MSKIINTINNLLQMAREAQAEKDRERVKIGFIFNVPPAQLTEEQIEDYKRKVWMQSLVFPVINPMKNKRKSANEQT